MIRLELRRCRRPLARLAALVLVAGAFLVAAPAAAFAAAPDVNGVHGHYTPLGAVNIILIFLVAPFALLVVLSLIFLRPGSAPGAQRYRPQRGWSAHPTWIGVPAREDHDAPALEGARHLQEEAGTAPGYGQEPPPRPHDASGPGGARGSW